MPGTIHSLRKAADILNLFTQDFKLCGISDMARMLDIPKATVQNLVRTLEEIGYLEKDIDSSKYKLGPVLFQLGMKYATTMDLAVIARTWLERLCQQFNESAHAGMLVGGRVIIVLRVEPENRFMVFPQTGSVIPFHTSSIGKIILAFMDPKKRESALSNYSFMKLTERSIVNLADFMNELDNVREDGIGFDLQESVTGLSCVGGPILNHRGDCIAAFSISGNSFNIEKNREEIVSAVRYVSSQMSSQLGYRKNI